MIPEETTPAEEQQTGTTPLDVLVATNAYDNHPSVLCMQNVRSEFMEALANAQGEFPEIVKDREVTVRLKDKQGNAAGSYKFKYATLDAILAGIRPALSKFGLLPHSERPQVEGDQPR